MLSKKIIKELNAQINRELQSAYNYLGMAAYCENNGLPGCAQWLVVQAREERAHADKIFDYLADLNADISLDSLSKPKQSYQDVGEIFKSVLKAEEDITKAILDLANLAEKEGDQLTHNFLEWFLEEQREEIASATAILDKIKLTGTSGVGLYMLDTELGSRVNEPAA